MATTVPAMPRDHARETSARLGRWRALVAMARPSQIALVGLVAANGMLLGVWQGAAAGLSVVTVALAATLTLLAAAAVHLANEAADAETDRLTIRTPYSGGSGALQASGLDRRRSLWLALGLAAVVAGAAVAAGLSGVLSVVASALLLAGLLGGLAYSLPPVSAMRRGWGEPLNALLGGMLLPLFGVAVVAGDISVDAMIAFLPFVFVVLLSVMSTAWPDRVADAATGKRTMQVRRSPGELRLIALAATLAFGVATLLSAATAALPYAMAGLLVAPFLVEALLRYTRDERPAAAVAAMVGLGVITCGSLVVGLLSRGGPGSP